MFRLFFIINAIFIFCISVSFAQSGLNGAGDINAEYEDIPMDDLENPDETGAQMPNVGISEEKHIEEVVEGTGYIPFTNIAFRTGPSPQSRVIRYSSEAEKIILIGETDEWYKVLMYNNQEAYILKKYVKTSKIFQDESGLPNSINKKISIEIHDLLDKFDKTVRESSYAKKYQMRPVLTLQDERKIKDTILLTLYYSCADINGSPIPSYKENDLYPYMQQLIELVLGRLILSKTENYELIIKTPSFDNSGKVENYNNIYSVITLALDKVDKENIRKNNASILKLATSGVPAAELFKNFPK